MTVSPTATSDRWWQPTEEDVPLKGWLAANRPESGQLNPILGSPLIFVRHESTVAIIALMCVRFAHSRTEGPTIPMQYFLPTCAQHS